MKLEFELACTGCEYTIFVDHQATSMPVFNHPVYETRPALFRS
jgi:hypothetical protein